MLLVMMLTTATAWAQTTITPTTPSQDGDGYYLIGSAAELYGFAGLVNNGNATANAKLTADIIVNENVLDAYGDANTGDFVQWISIGNDDQNTTYSGTFDGQGHTISGLYVSGESHRVGLIGKVNGSATIKNLGIVDSYFNSSGNFLGSIVGDVNLQSSVTLANVYSTSTVKGVNWIGGLVGGSGKGSVTIINSYFAGKTSADWSYDDHHDDLVSGAFVGPNSGTLNIVNTFVVGTSLYGTTVTAEQMSNGTVAAALHYYQDALADGSMFGMSGGKTNFSGTIDGVSVPTANITLHTFTGDTKTYSSKYVVGNTTTLPVNVACEGYNKFAGWYNNANLVGNAVTSISSSETGDKEYWAKYKQSHTVTFELNGGLIEGGEIDHYIEGEVTPLPALVFNGGASFEGWYTTSDCSGDRYVAIPATATEDITFYAKWGEAKTSFYLMQEGEPVPASLLYEGENIVWLDKTTEQGYKISNNEGKHWGSGDDITVPYAGGEYAFSDNSGSKFRVDQSGFYVFTLTDKGGENWFVSVLKLKSMLNCDVASIPTQVYTGSAIEPEVTVNDGETPLDPDEDYEVTYSNNIDAGTATATITGKGDYSGKTAATFTIVNPVTTSYVDASGTLHENVEAVPLDNTMTTLPAGWYVVNSDVAYTGTVTLAGDVNLILCDGAEMSVDGSGISLECNGALTIYGQVGGTGTLTLNSNQTTISVIGNLTICGGSVSATSSGDDVINTTGDIILKGGTLTACADDGTSNAINCSGTLNLSGGKVVATKGAIYAENGATIASGLAYTNGSTAYTTSISSNDLEALGAVTLELADIVITSANFAQYFDYVGDFEYNNATPNTSTTGGYFLKDGVPVGSTLDFQGEFIPDATGNYNPRIFINKRVNITSSDKSAVFKPYKEDNNELYWWDFGILEGADYTEVKNLQFQNCWVFNHGSSYVTFDGIDMKVEDVRIGSSVGALSIRTIQSGGHASDHTTVMNSVFYCRDNGGNSCISAAFGAPYVTFHNNTITLEGNVGNGINVNTFNSDGNAPAPEYGTFTNNVITNEGSANAICWCIIPCGQGNLIENNTINYAGNAINKQYYSSVSEEQKKNIYRNNTTTLGGSISVYEYSVVENNQVSGQLSVAKGATATGNTVAEMTVSQDATVKSNTVNGSTTISGTNVTFQGNTVNGSTTISGTNVTFQGNTVNGNTTISKTTASFTDNAINGMLTLNSASGGANDNNTITGNVILSTGQHAIELKSSDNTVSGNILISADYEGDAAVKTTMTNTIADNTLAAYESATASSHSNTPYIITSETTAIKAGDNAGTFYYVPTDATVTINGDFAITPNEGATSPKVNLMLGNGSQLNVGNISGSDCSLTLYGQSMDGMLTATGTISAKNINLNGATVKANGYSGTVNIASGITYYDGTGASYTEGNLSADQISDIAGKKLRTYDYRTVSYVKADGTTATADAIPLTSGGATTLAGGWYVAQGTVNYTGKIALSGDVNLILADGCTLNIGTADARISDNYCILGDNNSLTIYGQSTEGDNVGQLNAYNSSDTYRAVYVKNYTQYGGKVTIDDTEYNALYFENGTLTLARGTLNARAHDDGRCAILLNNGHTATVSGGTLIATATGEYSCAINANLTMTGGTVTATGYSSGIVGDVTLGWTSPDDCITASSYTGSVTIADGKALHNGSEVLSSGIVDAGDYETKLNGKTLTPAIVLADDADNTSAIATATTLCTGGKTLAVQLSGHTLYKDGYWNTLCLPFSVTDGDTNDGLTFSGTPLEGATVMELNSSTSNLDGKGQLTLNFSDATSIEAGKPYIVKWQKAADYDADPTAYDIVNPVFSNVTVDKINNDVDFSGGTFMGNYKPLEITVTGDNPNRNDYVVLAVGTNGNMLGYVNTNRTLGAFHAYFYIPANGGNPGASSFVLNADDESTQTGIGHTEITEITENSDAWYTLDGRKLQGKPTQKGIYIYKGKKVKR